MGAAVCDGATGWRGRHGQGVRHGGEGGGGVGKGSSEAVSITVFFFFFFVAFVKGQGRFFFVSYVRLLSYAGGCSWDNWPVPCFRCILLLFVVHPVRV